MTIFLTIAILIIGAYVINKLAESSSSSLQDDYREIEEFRVARWVKSLIVLEILMSLTILYFPAFEVKTSSAWFFYGTISIGLFIVGFLAYTTTSKWVIRIGTDFVEIKFNNKQELLKANEIVSVYTVNGFIVIDCGRIPRTTIPLVFRSNGKLLNRLKSRCRM